MPITPATGVAFHVSPSIYYVPTGGNSACPSWVRNKPPSVLGHLTPTNFGRGACFATGTIEAVVLAANPPKDSSEYADALCSALYKSAAKGVVGWLLGKAIEWRSLRRAVNGNYAWHYKTEVDTLKTSDIWPMVRDHLPPSLDDVAAVCQSDLLSWARRVRHYFVDGLSDAGHVGGRLETWKPERIEQCQETIEAAIDEVRAKAPDGWFIPPLSNTERNEVTRFIDQHVASDISVLASPMVTGEKCARVLIYLIARPYALGGDPGVALPALLKNVRTGYSVESALKGSDIDLRLINRGSAGDVKPAVVQKGGAGTSTQAQVQLRSDSRDVHVNIGEKLHQQMPGLPDHVAKFIDKFIEKSKALLVKGKGARPVDIWTERIPAQHPDPAYDLRVRQDGDSGFVLESCHRVT